MITIIKYIILIGTYILTRRFIYQLDEPRGVICGITLPACNAVGLTDFFLSVSFSNPQE